MLATEDLMSKKTLHQKWSTFVRGLEDYPWLYYWGYCWLYFHFKSFCFAFYRLVEMAATQDLVNKKHSIEEFIGALEELLLG